MERGQSKAVTGKEHLERNDFIIEKQKAELQRMDAAKRHKEEQINLAEQEHSKRSGFSFRKRENEETGTVQ